MRVGIDASNLRAGGGITHLRELLEAADPSAHGIRRVTVWAGRTTVSQLPERAWLDVRHEHVLDGSLPVRVAWQARRLGVEAREACDVLFAPGGLCVTSFRPFVTMSRNMLPFEHTERRRYGASWMRAKLALLRGAQSLTFRRADAIVFLTEYARRTILTHTGELRGTTAVIPHGVNRAFRCPPRAFVPLDTRSSQPACRILYVSIVDVYKHQWQVADAVATLRKRGWPVEIEFVGAAYPPALARLRQTMSALDPEGKFLRYRGFVPYDALPGVFASADVFVFASTCENMPNILLEGMASGLPIACSSRGPMPEILGDGGTYFDPEDPTSIADAVERLLADADFRAALAAAARRRSGAFSWARAARETFELIADTARRHPRNVTEATATWHQ